MTPPTRQIEYVYQEFYPYETNDNRPHVHRYEVARITPKYLWIYRAHEQRRAGFSPEALQDPTHTINKTLRLDRIYLEQNGRAWHQPTRDSFSLAPDPRFLWAWGPTHEPEQNRPVFVPTCLRVLRLGGDANREDVDRAYRILAKTVHPDAGGNADAFRTIHAAYEQACRLALSQGGVR